MGLPHTTPFYSQDGSIKGLLGGLNYGSSQATIMNPGRQSFHQSLNQQLRQVFETFELLKLELGIDDNIIKSSVFHLSFVKDDRLGLFLRNSSSVMDKCSSLGFGSILANQMVRLMRNLYNANVRKIICMSSGCTPRTVFEWYNSTAGVEGRGRDDEINELVLECNIILDGHIVTLNSKLPDAYTIFCDVFEGIMETTAIHNTTV